MTDRSQQPIRVTGDELDQHGKHGERNSHDLRSRRAARAWRRPRHGPTIVSRGAATVHRPIDGNQPSPLPFASARREYIRATAGFCRATSPFRDRGRNLQGSDLAVVVNPNNPDGRIIRKEELLTVSDELNVRGGLLLVDEAFMDVGPPKASLAGEIDRGNIVLLRSFGKFFGLAGLRLSFALAAPDLE